eukprot:Colp12_sorted_trinity150504_noHs@8861
MPENDFFAMASEKPPHTPRLKCPHCPYGTDHRGHFHLHLETHIDPLERSVTCRFCRVTVYTSKFRDHVRTMNHKIRKALRDKQLSKDGTVPLIEEEEPPLSMPAALRHKGNYERRRTAQLLQNAANYQAKLEEANNAENLRRAETHSIAPATESTLSESDLLQTNLISSPAVPSSLLPPLATPGVLGPGSEVRATLFPAQRPNASHKQPFTFPFPVDQIQTSPLRSPPPQPSSFSQNTWPAPPDLGPSSTAYLNTAAEHPHAQMAPQPYAVYAAPQLSTGSPMIGSEDASKPRKSRARPKRRIEDDDELMGGKRARAESDSEAREDVEKRVEELVKKQFEELLEKSAIRKTMEEHQQKVEEVERLKARVEEMQHLLHAETQRVKSVQNERDDLQSKLRQAESANCDLRAVIDSRNREIVDMRRVLEELEVRRTQEGGGVATQQLMAAEILSVMKSRPGPIPPPPPPPASSYYREVRPM